MARRIDVDAPVEPRGRGVRAPFEHHARAALDQGVLALRRKGRNDEAAPAGLRLAGAARGEPRRFDPRAALDLELGDDRRGSEQLVDRDADAAGERRAESERRRMRRVHARSKSPGPRLDNSLTKQNAATSEPARSRLT